MGLDAVEILMRTEEVFGISIPDGEAEEVKTPGDLFRFVLGCRKATGPSVCMTSSAFYTLRRGLTHLGFAKREQVQLSQSIAELFPRRTRREKWGHLQTEIGLSLPELAHAGRLQLAFFLAGPVLVLLASIMSVPLRQELSLHLLVAALLLAACGLATFLTLLRWTPCLASELPPGMVTIKDLTQAAVATNYPLLSERLHAQDEEGIWLTVRAIIAEQVGLDPEAVWKDATWRQLGIE